MSHRRHARALPWAFLSYALIRSPALERGTFQVIAREAGRRLKKTFDNKAEALELIDELHRAGVREIELVKSSH